MLSCKKSTKPDDDDPGIDGALQDIWLMVNNQASLAHETVAAVVLKEESSTTLKLNDQNCELIFVNQVMGRYYYYFNVPYQSPGTNVSYEMKVQSKTHSGTINLPSAIEVDWPEFNDQADYRFSWTMASNPQKLELYYEIEGSNGDVADEVNLSVSARNYAIPKSKWSNLGEVHFLNITMAAINSKVQGDCLLIGQYEVEYDMER